jgi:CBS domain-containing protein
MTEKIARRGLRIPEDYDADVFAQVTVGEVMTRDAVTLFAGETVGKIADRIAIHDPAISSYQAWPLVDETGDLAGIITRQDLLRALEIPGGREMALKEAGSTALVVAYPDASMHDAVVSMLTHGIGRLPVVRRDNPGKLAGYLSRTSLLATRLRALTRETKREPGWLQAARKDDVHAV